MTENTNMPHCEGGQQFFEENRQLIEMGIVKPTCPVAIEIGFQLMFEKKTGVPAFSN